MAPANETELIAIETAGQIRKVLDRSIEEWMVYLHPTQRAIANATFNGPARVRGGPGTGKTVVALHRARACAQAGRSSGQDPAHDVPEHAPSGVDVANGLLDPQALERLDVRNIDQLAREIVVGANGGNLMILDSATRTKMADSLIKRHGLGKVMAEPRVESWWWRLIGLPGHNRLVEAASGPGRP